MKWFTGMVNGRYKQLIVENRFKTEDAGVFPRSYGMNLLLLAEVAYPWNIGAVYFM